MKQFKDSLREFLIKRPVYLDYLKDNETAVRHADAIIEKLTDAEVAALYLAIMADRQNKT